jgi:hypothetical protein
MHRPSPPIWLLAAGLALATGAASAQVYGGPVDRDPRSRQGPNYGGDRYGRPPYAADPGGAAERVLRNLSGAARASYTDRHEREHFDRAIFELRRFEDRWNRQRRFDTGNLDRAIDNMKHLAGARQVDPRARNGIAQDIEVLRAVRSQSDRYRY